MNRWQEACCKAYADGDFAYMLAEKTIPLDQMLDGCGDTVFKSLMIELSSSEDCDSDEEAVKRTQRVVSDVSGVLSAIEAL